jgi:hypothetical protein
MGAKTLHKRVFMQVQPATGAPYRVEVQPLSHITYQKVIKNT